MKSLYSALGGWLGWLGVLAGALSVISLATRVFRVGLRTVFADVVEFYRALIRPVYDALQLARLPFELTQPMLEGLALYLALLGLSVRAEFSASRRLIYMSKYAAELDKGRLGRKGFKWTKAIRCAFLVPVVTAQPIRDMFHAAKFSREAEGDVMRAIHAVMRDDHNARVLAVKESFPQTLWMFVAFPVAVLVFFALNSAS